MNKIACRNSEAYKAAHREEQRRFHRAHPESIRRTVAKRNPEHVRARKIAQNAVKTGVLRKLGICQDCERTCRTELHHCDYAKPLEVRELCVPCHRIADAKLRTK